MPRNSIMPKSQIGNSELISQVNKCLVLEAVRVMQPTFRAAVARKTGLKPATITCIANELIAQGLLEEIPGKTENGRAEIGRWGRPPLMLQVNADSKRILAIDLEPDQIRVALSNLLIQPLVYREKPNDRFSTPQVILNKIIALCQEALQGVKRSSILGAGVSLAGLIDSESGVGISSTNMPKWRDVPVQKILEQKLKIPVRVERSLHLAALYERWSNPHLADRTTLIISVRTGVGMSMMHRGQLYVGNKGFDGEIGHTVIDIDGPQCECGNRGCLETFVSATAIAERARRAIANGKGRAIQAAIDVGDTLTPELIYRLARGGDDDCIAIVCDIGHYLGIAIANVINLFAPHEVVISGSIDLAEDLILDAIKDQVNKSALPRTRENTLIRLARERERLPLLGAAVLVAQQVFELPRLSHTTAQEQVWTAPQMAPILAAR
jgi:N-acetylglucosamine repressor